MGIRTSVSKRTWQTKNGEKAAWVVAYTHKGKKHLKALPTKRAATRGVPKSARSQRVVPTPAAASITVAKAGALWLALAEMDWPRRLDGDARSAVTPFLGTQKLAELTTGGIQEFCNHHI